MELNVLPEQIQINQALAIASEDELPSVAALRHMVRDIYDYDTNKACYLGTKYQKTSRLSPIKMRWGRNFSSGVPCLVGTFPFCVHF